MLIFADTVFFLGGKVTLTVYAPTGIFFRVKLGSATPEPIPGIDTLPHGFTPTDKLPYASGFGASSAGCGDTGTETEAETGAIGRVYPVRRRRPLHAKSGGGSPAGTGGAGSTGGAESFGGGGMGDGWIHCFPIR